MNLFPKNLKGFVLPSGDSKKEEDEIYSGSTRENELFEVKFVINLKVKSDSSLKNENSIIGEKCNCKEVLEEQKDFSVENRQNNNKVHIEDKVADVKKVSSQSNLLNDNSEIRLKPKSEQKALMPAPSKKKEKVKEYDIVEVDDPEKGVVSYKTRVIESTAKLNTKKKRSNRISIERIHNILKNSNIPLDKFKLDDLDEFNCNCDLKEFYWDNLDAYYQKKAKNVLKDNTDINKLPKVTIMSLNM